MKNIVAIFAIALSLISCTKKTITIHTIGDSTMADYAENTTDVRGWGEMLNNFAESHVVIANYARGGRSSKSFYAEGLWQNVLDSIKEGDYVLIQFAHNDEKNNGAESTDGRGTSPWGEYQRHLRLYVSEAREKGATPIFIAPITRRYFDDAKHITQKAMHNLATDVSDTTLNYVLAMRTVATELNVPFVDMTTRTRDIVENFGPELSKKLLYVSTDNTHTSSFGAAVFAQATVSELKNNNILNDMFDDSHLIVNPNDFDLGTIYTSTKQICTFDAININDNLKEKRHYTIKTSDADIKLQLFNDTTEYSVLNIDTLGAIAVNIIVNPTQQGELVRTITILSDNETHQLTIRANVTEPTERTPLSATLTTPLATPENSGNIKLHEATLTGLQSTIDGIAPTDNEWPAEIDENSNRYIEFHITTPQTTTISTINVNSNPDLCYRIVCSQQKTFANRTTIGECFDTNHNTDITFNTSISCTANSRLFFRIYPWSKKDTKETFEIGPINISGIAYK